VPLFQNLFFEEKEIGVFSDLLENQKGNTHRPEQYRISQQQK